MLGNARCRRPCRRSCRVQWPPIGPSIESSIAFAMYVPQLSSGPFQISSRLQTDAAATRRSPPPMACAEACCTSPTPSMKCSLHPALLASLYCPESRRAVTVPCMVPVSTSAASAACAVLSRRAHALHLGFR
jgi:hypothetical protein